MIVEHENCRCGSWMVTKIGDRSNSEYFCCASCGTLLESTDPKEAERIKTAVADLLAKTQAHEADDRIVHKK